MRVKIKFIFLFLFVLFLGFLKASTVYAYQSTWTCSCDYYYSGFNYSGTCAKGDSCPTCNSTFRFCNSMCSSVSRWKKASITNTLSYQYSYSCGEYMCYGCKCQATYVYQTETCSTGNKCLTDSGTSHNEIGLRAGDCNCGYGGIHEMCCSDTQYVGPVYCQKMNYDGLYPPEGRCPDGSHGIDIPLSARLGNGNIDQNWIDSVCPKCSPVNGQNGVCGTATGQVFPNTPTANLCSVGTPTAVTLSGNTYSWTCNGTAGTCKGANGSSVGCSAVHDTPPTVTSFQLQNSSGTVIPSESISGVNKNQICQTYFESDKIAKFAVTLNDNQGASDINSVELVLGSNHFAPDSGSVQINGNSMSATFSLKMPDNIAAGDYKVSVVATDKTAGVSTTTYNANRTMKFWDCKVPVSGKLYDGSAGQICPNYGTDLATKADFKSLQFKVVGQDIYYSTDASGTSYTSSSGQGLIWGSYNYSAQFNPDLGIANLNMRLNGSNCSANLNAFSINNNSVVNPYANPVSLTADFSGVVNQEAWYQVGGGGLAARLSLNNNIPVTCSIDSTNTCKAAISIDSNNNTNGVTAANSDNISCGSSTSNCKFGINNNWKLKVDLNQKPYDYNYFYNQYFVKLGLGTTFSSSTSLDQVLSQGNTGVYFVNGDLDINSDNSLNTGDFLMIISNGNIIVDPSVKNMSGIFVGKNISVGGTSAFALNINGTLYSPIGNVQITRGFDTKSNNNLHPAVVVNYKPDLLFNIPGKLAKVISGWKQGL